MSDKIKVITDSECYINYWLCSFKRLDTGKFLEFEMYDGHDLDRENLQRVLEDERYEFITFNGNKYDIPVIRHALYGATCEELKRLSDALIDNNKDVTPWNFHKRFGAVELKTNHIDLIEVAKGDCSLKLYAGRLHAKKMQDLPIEVDTVITPEQRIELRTYCRNDLENTELLFTQLIPQIDQRRLMSEQYGIDLRSKSDAQIAEAVIKSEVEKITGRPVKKSGIEYKEFFYDIPDFITFRSEQLNNVLEVLRNNKFTISDKGVVQMPEALAELKISIGDSIYQMGSGGLHSTESERAMVATTETILNDIDVGSYYPTLMVNNGLYPSSMGQAFLDVFKDIRARRLAAKSTNKIVADLLKITLNGTFGKLGSVYSIFYAPKMMVQVTVTGQLALLMLIERLEEMGISVISANTDGLVLHYARTRIEELRNMVSRWEKRTGLEMEYAEYSALYQRDVNSYIAIKPDGKVKTKGFFAPVSLEKNPQNEICVDAVIEYLKNGTPFETTVRNCRDIRKFVSVMRVTGGAVKDGEYLGKVVRFYYAVGASGCIQRKLNGNTVPRSTGAKPLMELPEAFPTDINYDWYLKECQNLLYDLGVEKRPVPIKLPRKNSKDWKQMFADGLIVEFEGKFVHIDDVP